MSSAVITIYDGNNNDQVVTNLYQWDQNIKIKIANINITNNAVVHFWNKRNNTALVVLPSDSGINPAIQAGTSGYVFASIPNILLQDANPIAVYIYDTVSQSGGTNGGIRTNDTIYITVIPRGKPDNYVMSENVSYSLIVSGDIEADNIIAGNTVKALEFLEVHGINDQRRLATERYVDNKAAPLIAMGVGHTLTAPPDKYSHAEGGECIASAFYSHAEGYQTQATEACAHAEGNNTQANAQHAHAEGNLTVAGGRHSHAEGQGSHANADNSHTEGTNTEVGSGATSAHAEGSGTSIGTDAVAAHAEGFGTVAIGQHSHAEGQASHANGNNSHAEGYATTTVGNNAHAEGSGTSALANNSHAEGTNTGVGEGAISAHAEGSGATVSTGAVAAHAEGEETTASGRGSHAEGYQTEAIANYSHAEGVKTTAAGYGSHVEGNLTSTKDGAYYSHAEGWGTIAAKSCQHVQGRYNIEDNTSAFIIGNGTNIDGTITRSNAFAVDWYGSVAEGSGCTASGQQSHAEGLQTHANGPSSHTEGGLTSTDAGAYYSHAEGWGTVANGDCQHVMGRYNEPQGDGVAFIIGCGTKDPTTDVVTRNNALTVGFNGDARFKGTVYSNNNELATQEYAQKIYMTGSDGNLYVGVLKCSSSGKPVFEYARVQ